MSKQKNLIEASQNVTFDTDGNVGIGTSSPRAQIDFAVPALSSTLSRTNSDYQVMLEAPSGTGNYAHNIAWSESTGLAVPVAAINAIDEGSGSATGLTFATGNNTSISTRMTIDSSGNLLVGQSSSTAPASGNVIGAAISPLGYISTNRTSVSAEFGTQGNGDIVVFRESGSTVGSIGTDGNDIYVASVGSFSAGLLFNGAGSSGNEDIRPCRSSGSAVDNAIDLGDSSARFDDIYATNGSIQTSDRNEKQQIASLTTAEMNAAKAISQLFKTFKWNDSVTANGDAARTHAGVIAQEVETAMTNAGLDAGDYAFFISSTWWETQTDVPAVVADPENGVEAKDAYTRTDTYDTLADAPAGATERTRKGIRYPELLSFVGAATEQRLADIEARLTALEAV